MDFVVPIDIRHIKIIHRDATFDFEGVTPAFEAFEGVPLGIVKHRIYWDDRRPLCKSNDNVTGYPQAGFQQKITQASTPPIKYVNKDGTIECKACPFRGDGKSSSGPCKPEWSLLLWRSENSVFNLRLRGASLWSASQYLRTYDKANMPAFIDRMSLSLNLVKRNQIRYSELKLKRMSPTDKALWPTYLSAFLKVRDHLTVPPSTSSLPDSSRGKLTPLSM